MKRLISSLFLLAPLALPASEAGRVLAPWLKTASHPAVIGMGDAAVAVPGLSSLAYNPASIALADKVEAAFSHSEAAFGLRADEVDLVHPNIGFGAIALQVRGLWDNAIEGRDAAGNLTGSLTYLSSAFGAALAAPISGMDKTWAGIQLKGVYNSYTPQNFDATGAVDLGLLMEVSGGVLPPDTMLLGLSVLNLGLPIKYEAGSFSTPLVGRAGIQWHPQESKLRTAADLVYFEDSKLFTGKLGVDYALFKVFGIRAGYSFDPNNIDYLAGASAGFQMHLDPWTIDYSFTPQGELGQNHRVALTAALGNGFLQELKGKEEPKTKSKTDAEPKKEEKP